MPTRIHRIYAHQIQENKEKILHQRVHIVMSSGSTAMGNIVAIHENSLILGGVATFWYNQTKHEKTILLTEIQEIHWDVKR